MSDRNDKAGFRSPSAVDDRFGDDALVENECGRICDHPETAKFNQA
jgi:hypothetical protein